MNQYHFILDGENSVISLIKEIQFLKPHFFTTYLGKHQRSPKLLQKLEGVDILFATASGNNALDFQISAYLGKLHATADPEITFVIVSDDLGFNAVIDWLEAEGRKAFRLDVKSVHLITQLLKGIEMFYHFFGTVQGKTNYDRLLTRSIQLELSKTIIDYVLDVLIERQQIHIVYGEIIFLEVEVSPPILELSVA